MADSQVDPTPQRADPSTTPAQADGDGGGHATVVVPPVAESPFRLMIGRDLVALGFVLVVAVFALAVIFLTTAADIVAVIGPITTLIGSLLGAVFGVQIGSQGRDEETKKRVVREQQLAQALTELPPSTARQLTKSWRDSGIGNPSESDF